MINVIIIEDEDIIRQGMVSFLEWEKYDMQIVGEADNGEDGLNIIKSQKIDVVITDIKMPFMDGISMLEHIREIQPDILVVIVSGYDEFEYARRAVKAGAYDYILKPLKISYLEEVLQKIQRKILDGRQDAQELGVLKEIRRESENILQVEIFRNLVLGKQPEQNLASEYAAAFAMQERSFATGIIRMEDFALRSIDCGYLELLELDQKFGTQVNAFCGDDGVCTVLENGLGERILCFCDEKADRVHDSMDAVRDSLKQEEGEMFSITIAFGTVGKEPKHLQKSYHEAISTLESRYLNPEESVLYFEDMGQYNNNLYINFDDSRLLMHIRSGDKVRIGEEVGALREALRENGVISHLHIVLVVSGVYFNVRKLPIEVGGSAEEALLNPLESFRAILSQKNLDAMMEAFKSLCLKISDYLVAYSSGKYANVLLRAREYIAAHYMEESLPLEQVAQNAYISSSYLSIIFKKETGETFIEYLTRVRMEEAVKLLMQPGIRTYEVAAAVGYGNPTYFSTVFKKYYGHTPSEFRNRQKSADKEKSTESKDKKQF